MLASTENWLVFFHLLGAFALFGGAAVAGVGFEAARRRTRPGEIALLLGLTRVGVALVGAGSVLALAFGLWLVHEEHVGYGAGWVQAALGLFVVMGAVGGIGGQRPKRARKLAEQLDANKQDESLELRALLDDPAARALNLLSAVLLLAIVVLMVFKPGG